MSTEIQEESRVSSNSGNQVSSYERNEAIAIADYRRRQNTDFRERIRIETYNETSDDIALAHYHTVSTNTNLLTTFAHKARYASSRTWKRT